MILPRIVLPKIRLSKRAVRDAATGIAGVLALALLTAMGAVVARDFSSKKAPAADAPVAGAARMVVTAAGPGGSAVPLASVFVDGKELCRSAPCTIEPLEKGVHFVKVVAPGYTEAAARAVTLNATELRTVHFDLQRVPEPVAPAPPPPVVATISPAELPTEPRSEEQLTASAVAVPISSPAAPRERAPQRAPAVSGNGTLNMSSNPPSNIVLDGKPIGMTPQRASVSAGSHSVLFVHSELGRAARQVVVPAGGSQSVSANFGG